jgi:hypothetical protein
MKHLLILLLFSFILPPSVSAQAIEDYVGGIRIIGGSGFIKTNWNPNGVAKIRVLDQRLDGSFAYDTANQKLYQYDRHLPIGQRWQVFAKRPQTQVIRELFRNQTVDVLPTTTDLVIGERIGLFRTGDSLVLNFPFYYEDHEVNIYTAGNAKVWVSDLILNSTTVIEFEDGNGKPENFGAWNKRRQCIEFFDEFGIRNAAYDSDYFETQTGKSWKITVKYLKALNKFLVHRTPYEFRP